MRLLEKHFVGDGGIREMVGIALPMVVSHACDTIMTFTDRLFLSRLGPVHMSAAMGGGLSTFLMISFFLGLTGYSTALVAQNLGAGRKERCGTASAQAFLIAIAAYPLILAAAPLGHRFFQVVGVEPEQLALQTAYFDIMIYGTIFGLLRGCLSSFFSGIGKTRVVMIAAMVSMVVNIIANYALIYGKWGFPAMGIRGAAWGTILGSAFGVAVLGLAYSQSWIRKEFGVFSGFRFDWRMMKRLLYYGYPAGFEFLLNMLAFTSMVLIFHSRGLATAAAVTTVFNWDMVSFVPLIGIEIAVTSLMGRYMGAGRPETAHRATMSGLKIGLVYSSVILFFFVFFPVQLVDVFRPDQADAVFDAARPVAVFMIRLASLYVMIEAMVVVFAGALRGAGDTFWAMAISVTLHWILVPILLVMFHVFGASVETAWMVVVGVFMLFSLLFYLRYRSGKWKTIRVISPEEGTVVLPAEGFHEVGEL